MSPRMDMQRAHSIRRRPSLPLPTIVPRPRNILNLRNLATPGGSAKGPWGCHATGRGYGATGTGPSPEHSAHTVEGQAATRCDRTDTLGQKSSVSLARIGNPRSRWGVGMDRPVGAHDVGSPVCHNRGEGGERRIGLSHRIAPAARIERFPSIRSRPLRDDEPVVGSHGAAGGDDPDPSGDRPRRHDHGNPVVGVHGEGRLDPVERDGGCPGEGPAGDDHRRPDRLRAPSRAKSSNDLTSSGP